MNSENTQHSFSYKKTAELKADARQSLRGHLGTAVSAVIIYLLATVCLSLMEYGVQTQNFALSFALSLVFSFVIGICTHMFEIGLCCIFMLFQYGRKALLGDLFYAFRFHSDNNVIISALLSLINIACVLPASVAVLLLPNAGSPIRYLPAAALFVIGLFAMLFFRLCYGMTPFLLLDFPELSAPNVLRTSRKMMRGQKGKLLRLYLSFVPLLLLGLLTLGISNLWTICYIYAAAAAFYRDRADAAACAPDGNRHVS